MLKDAFFLENNLPLHTASIIAKNFDNLVISLIPVMY